ncbi:MAG: hypothetical protein VR64_06380 [Desulfatitalea sp. BRH_c12]|nr:MAG: hypothetical protein VR64_06380 [Desulfatitalea sp. BRH_c12]
MRKGSQIRLALRKACRLVEKVGRKCIRDTGLGLSDFAILETLLREGPSPINQIGERVHLTSGAMTAAIDRLEKIRYVKRIRDTEDGRCCYVALTKPGQGYIEAAHVEYEHNLESVANALSTDEQEELVRLLEKVVRHVRNRNGK